MNVSRLGAFLIVSLSVLALGCANNGTPSPNREAKIKAALEKLDPADRKRAEEQKYCAVETENRLGVMGTPIKVMVKDQPVFLCCEGCEKTALKDPEQTLAKVKELKATNAESKEK